MTQRDGHRHDYRDSKNNQAYERKKKEKRKIRLLCNSRRLLV